MNMESPVRICLGAALVVILLLLSGTIVSGNALPLETTATTVKDERPTRHRINNTVWTTRHKVKNADVALNELNPKESISEEHTEKNAKYKDRGRVKFHSQIKSTTESPTKRVRSTTMTSSTEASNVVVITPTSNVKNAAQIIDSMKIYKKTKTPDATSSTTIAPVSVKTEVKSEEEEEDYEDEEEEEEEDDKETFQKYTSTKFHDSTNFFTIPSYNDGDDFSHDFDKKDSENKVVKQDYSTSFGSFSSFFPKESDDESYKSDSFFDFASELTTPKNDFFDKKFQEISKSIMKNLASIKAKAPPQNASNAHKVVKEDVGVETLSNGTPSNKSTVIIKNTKEIRLLDNDEAGSANKELSDVHGTSIYYEMSVLSTETYAINHSNDEDCDKDTLPAEPTASTSSEEELASIKATQATVLPVSTKAVFPKSKTEPYSRVPSSFIPVSSASSNLLSVSSLPTRFLPVSSEVPVILNSVSPDPVSKQSSVISSSTEKISELLPVIVNSVNPVPVSTPSSVMSTSTEKSSRVFSTSFTTRNRSYSKRLNFTGTKDSPNSVTSRTEQATSHQNIRPLTRKFHYTTPKAKPIWMAPRRNVTKAPLTRPTYPTTIYSEHFNIRDKFSTSRPKQANNKTVLTTVSSEIDPVLQSDVSGIKKIVHSQSLSENSIPTLWKRGSTRYTTTTASSEETESGESDLEIPPTLTAWALASLRSPPSIASPAVNVTEPAKNLDENELQKVNDVGDKKETTTKSTTTITTPASNDFTSKKIVEIDQNKLAWRPLLASHQPIREAITVTTTTDYKSERLPAGSNVSARSSVKPVTTTEKIEVTKPTEPVTDQSVEETEQPWIPVTSTEDKTTETDKEIIKNEEMFAVETTKSTGFESITKLPADVTTPNDDVIAKSDENKTVAQILTTVPTTTDYEITTIRFTYVPTEKITETTAKEYARTTPKTRWHPVFPTRTKPTTWENRPITTYRPRYRATTSVIEMTTSIPESTPPIKASSQIIVNETKYKPDSTETPIKTTKIAIETMKIPFATTRVPIVTTKIPVETTEVPARTTERFVETTVALTESTTAPFTMTESTTDTTEIVSVTTEMSSETTEISSETTEYTEQTTMNQTTTEEPTTMTTRIIPIETTTPLNEIETTTIIVEVRTEINTERERPSTSTELVSSTEITGTPSKESRETASSSEENSDSNEVITQETTKLTLSTTATAPTTRSTAKTTTESPTEITKIITKPETYATEINIITRENAKNTDRTPAGEETTEDMLDTTTHSISEMEDLTSYAGDMTTEASSRVLTEETGSGAGVAIAVSTIGVIALILLIGLLLVVRRRGRRGVYAQRCTPVSLDAYSLDSVSVGHRKGNHRLRASKRSYGNPAYDDEVTSHPMNYAALASFAMDIESIHAEFAEIPTVTVRPDEVPPGCEDKNRYSNVLPLPETRVPLSRIGNDPTTEYINASYITGPGNIRNYYIACQAPLPNTVVDFWRMIWEQNSRVIVMLTEYMENGVEKCYEYLPPSEISDNKRTFGDFQIILKKREQRDKYAISSVQLINLHTRTWREITHLWYFWPANGVPDDYDSVIDFLLEMRSYMKISQTAKEYDEEGVEVIYGDQSRSSFGSLAKLRSDDSSSGKGVNMYSPAKAEEQLRRNNVTNGTLGRMKDASEVEEVARPRPMAAVCASGAGRAAALLALDVCARALAARAADVPRVVRELRHQRAHALHNRHHYVFLYKVLSAYGHRLMGGGGVDAI